MFFTWLNPLVKFTKKHRKLKVKYYGELDPGDRVEKQIHNLRTIWEKKKANGASKNALMASVFSNFKWQYLQLMLLNGLQALLQLSSPLIINPLIQFIKTGENAWDPYVTFWDTSEINWLSFLTPRT